MVVGALLMMLPPPRMATPLTGQHLIDRFELYTDDTTELSSDEELSLANDKLRLVYMEQPWEFLRRQKQGVVGAGGNISVPNDFDELLENYNDDPIAQEPLQKVVFVGSDRNPHLVVPMGQRYAHTRTNICWFDPFDRSINFSENLSAGTPYLFDYKTSPDDLTLTTSPALPSEYHPMIVFSMLIDDEIIQKSEKARSNQEVNAMQYARYLKNLKLRDARFKLS